MPEFTREDFESGIAPYEWLYQFSKDPFTLDRAMRKVAALAKELKVTGVTNSYKNYVKSLQSTGEVIFDTNYTKFEDQPLELNCGQWMADDSGVSIMTPIGEKYACPHPIMPISRIKNIDTGEEKIALAYRKGRFWSTMVVDKDTIANARNIVSLAKKGIAVTSETSRFLVQYLFDTENLNLERIPEIPSVGRLGWVEGGFSPYVSELIFDGEDNFGKIYNAIDTKGDPEEWIGYIKELRKTGTIQARVAMVATFASVLIKPLHLLPFFVHFWSDQSTTGKTVVLLLATSAWANPEKGEYWSSFNSTTVGHERTAGFLNSLPLILDEFQLQQGDKRDFENTVYMLTEGVGRTRGNVSGGLQQSSKWANCVLCSGESPITNFMSGAGAFARIIEIECSQPIFSDFQAPLKIARSSYGHAGRMFVEHLQEDGVIEKVNKKYQEIYHQVSKADVMEKQAMAGATLLTADHFLGKWLFEDSGSISLDELMPYLQSRQDIDVGKRAYEYICDTISANSSKFNPSLEVGEHWGLLKPGSGEVSIIRSVFEKICRDGGYASKAILSWMARNNIIRCSKKADGKIEPTRTVKILGTATRCVVMKMPEDDSDQEYLDELI